MKYLITILLLILGVNGFGQKDSSAGFNLTSLTDTSYTIFYRDSSISEPSFRTYLESSQIKPNSNFTYSFYDGKKQYIITMKNKDLGKLAKLFSEFLKSKGIKNTLKISQQ